MRKVAFVSRLQSAAGRVPQGWSFDQWPLRRKLAAAVALPIILAFAFGGLRVSSDLSSSRDLAQAADSVLVLRPVVAYNLSVQNLAAAGAVGGDGEISAITKYESAAANLRIALKAPGIPESAKASAQSALAIGQAVRTAKTQNGFSDVVIDKSGNTASLLSSAVSDLGLSADSDSAKIVLDMQDTIAGQRALTGQQLNLANTSDGSANARAVGQVGAETAALTRLQSTTQDASLVRQLLNENGRRAYTLQQDNPSKAQITDLGPVFQSGNTGYSKLIDGQLDTLEANLRQRASAFRTDALLETALILGVLALAIGLALALLRSLLRPIRMVRAGALDVAENRLPAAVAALRDGKEPPAFEAIPVHTTEEMGQLARAVDDMHTQALGLASDQARLRVQVGHMFETLSRRSTSLIDQQLSLIERLESDEEDPKRLQSLFRLDHLAARMRRNSDSLLVLAGTTTRRGVSGSISVSDAVRAAVSEVENYERIDIGDTSNDQVLGAVGSDLIHLVAEVVDNALAYSPPTTRVDIRGARTPEGGLLVEVTDRGLGMPSRDLAALNDRLANGGDITTDTARRMGLFVVGSLAKRHGIAVRLRTNGTDKQGITVSVHLPAGLLADHAQARTDRPSRPAVSAGGSDAPETPLTPPTSAVGGTTKAGLPSRVRGASGATPSPVAGAAKLLPTRTPGAHGPGAVNGATPPAKPVIDGAAPATAPSVSNGNGAPSGDAKPVNGHAAQPVNGHAEVEAKLDDASTVDDAPAEAEAVAVDAVADVPDTEAVSSAAKADSTPVDEVAAADAAPVESPRAASGLPVRKPRATGITEYREFEDAPSTAAADDKAGAKPEASSGKASRLTSWLPGRAKANAEAARLEAEAAEPPRMPSNLSAWLDHRAKLVEATTAREDAENSDESGAAPGDESTPDLTPASSDDSDAGTQPAGQTDDTTPELHVPDEWVAEVKADEATAEVAPSTEDSVTAESELTAEPEGDEPVVVEASVDAPPATPTPTQEGLPNRVPGSTTPAASLASPVSGTRPAIRAHKTSFFGARKARGAAAAVETQPVEAEPVVAEHVEPEPEPVVAEHVEPEPVVAEHVEPEPEPVVAEPEPEPVVAEHVEPEPVVAEPEPEVTEPQAQHDEAEATDVQESELSVPSEPEPMVSESQPLEADEEPVPAARLNDTPIFRAMMSRWLTDDPAEVPAEAEWSSNEADQAWSAAARTEGEPVLEESSAGLPKRRPGRLLVPGAMDSEEQPVPSAGARRDPEAIRRSLNRHKTGVSAARTEAQDGTHREEADVHH